MANIKHITSAFLDGFGSLGSVFKPAQRPGSLRNLISNAPSPTPHRVARHAAQRGSELHVIAARLRHSADLLDGLDPAGLTLRHAAAPDARPAHGAR